MNNDKLIAPVLKWVGGKRQLISALQPLLPSDITTYCEPFIGGGAMLFHIKPSTAFINDINPELICLYTVIKQDVEALIAELSKYENTADYFYDVRGWDRDKARYDALSDIEKAARVLYLNKTCYNGLYRVNNSGEFNAPFGKYRNPNIVNADGLRAVSDYFNTTDIRMTSQDYADVLQRLPEGAFVYLDPPYDPVSQSASFTGYCKGGFDRTEQVRLKQCCDDLTARGIKFMLSNSATDFILALYKDYDITVVKAKRAVNSVASKRGVVDEVVVRNYG